VQKSGSGNWVSAREGLTLAKGDKIKTDAGGKAVITFFDGSVIELNDNTAVSLDELTAKSASSPKTIKIGQTIGETTSTVVKLVDPASKYEINTPSAVAGVRGTIMQVAVAANGSTSVANVEGSVSVTAQGKEVNVPPGQHSVVQQGQAPAAPEPGLIMGVGGTIWSWGITTMVSWGTSHQRQPYPC